MIWGQLSKNLSEDPPPSQAISHAWWSTSVIPTYAGGVAKKIALGKSVRSYLKNN
jgi:hypothetical protein